MIRRQYRVVLCLLIAAGTLLVSDIAPAANTGHAKPVSNDRSGALQKPKSEKASQRKPFLIRCRAKYYNDLRKNGGVLYSAFHVNVPHVLKKLKRGPRDYAVHVSVCFGSSSAQVEMLQAFSEDADICDVWLFANPSKRRPRDDDVIWPGYDNPVINRVREVRTVTLGQRVLAVMQGWGNAVKRSPWGIRPYRHITSEEVTWHTLAVVGAGYDGILWGWEWDKRTQSKHLKRLTESLEEYLTDIGSALIVPWAQVSEDQPVSVLFSDKKLFIVLLNPAYMTVSPDGTKIQVPTSGMRRSGQLTLQIPPGYKIESGQYVSGFPVVMRREKDVINVDYRYSAGGELLIFPIKPLPATTRRDTGKSKSSVIRAKG